MSTIKSGFRVQAAALLGVFLLAAIACTNEAYAERGGNYLIITCTAYDNSAPLNEFIADRTAKGYDITQYTVPSGTSRDTILSYIEGLWGTEDEPEYVLIVGDAGSSSTATSTTIPCWNGTAFMAHPTHGTDLYYVTMPGGVSWYPDISMGRFSVAGEGGLQNAVDKTLFVEAGVYPDPDYVKRGVFLANPSTSGLAEPTHDWVIDTYFTPLGYTGTKVYVSQGGTSNDVTDAVNEGALFCVYMGHSDEGGWWDPSFNASRVTSLTNEGLYGLVFGWSCHTARFNTTCCGETWLRSANKGAAAYLSASCYIFWGSYSEWLPSAIHEKSFFASFFEKNIWEVGPAWKAGLYQYLTEHGNWDGDMNHTPTSNLTHCGRFFEVFHLLGDPALLLPRGTLSMNLVDDIPTSINPGEPTTIKVEIVEGSESYLEGSGELIYRFDDGAFQIVPLTHSGGDVYQADLPEAGCDDEPEFYVTAEGDGGAVVMLPPGAPTDRFTTVVGSPVSIHEEDFETPDGWTTEVHDATAGEWEVGVPVNDPGWVYGPDSDSDGSGQCYVTGNVDGNSDVDNGAVVLISPTIDMSGPGVNIEYDYYLYLTVADGTDVLLVEINTEDGVGAWTEIARHETHGGSAWRSHVITQADLSSLGVTATETTKVRFTCNDDGAQSIVEAGVDAFGIVGFDCTDVCLGDLDGDNDIDLADLAALLANYGQTGVVYEDGDLDEDGDVDLADLAALLSVYGTTCP